MELCIVNENYERVKLIDAFESFIWTERYDDIGDFKFRAVATYDLRSSMTVGTVLSNTESDRLMVIEKIEIKQDENGIKMFEAEGRSLECLLDTRAISTHSYTGGLTWKSSGTLGEIITLMVSKTCVTGSGLTTADIIPRLYVNDESRTTENISVAVRPQSLLSAVKELCDSDDLGFRIRLVNTVKEIGFTVYRGVDKSNVIFGASLDNLEDERYVSSNREHRNIAYVWAKDGKQMIQVATKDASTTLTKGLKRRVMHVSAEDIDFSDKDQTNETRYAQMRQRGREELAKNRRQSFMDGTISPNNGYRYRSDYSLGDVVRIFDQSHNLKKAIITEYIWVHDNEGERSYPTFRQTS